MDKPHHQVVAFAHATQADWKDSNLKCHMNFHVGVARLDQGGDATALDHYDKVPSPRPENLASEELATSAVCAFRVYGCGSDWQGWMVASSGSGCG